MCAWTTPTSRSYNDLITESIWNTDLVDNLNYLKSKADRRIAVIPIISELAALATGDGQRRASMPADLAGANLVDADVVVYTASSSGTPTYQIYNTALTHDVLSTRITIDAGEYSSYTAAAPPVIDTGYDEIAAGTRLRFDVDVAGTGTTGSDVHLAFLLS
jgi:hypothetical protein